MQAAINASGTYLPTDLPNPPIYSKTNPADAPILTLALTSKTLPLSKVEDFADTRLAQKISQLSGVGLVSISGGQKPAVRIQANPTSLSSYGLTFEDVRTAVSAANVNQAKGNFDGPQPGVHDRRQRSAAVERSLPPADRRLPQRRAGASLGRRHRRRRRRERQAGRLDERRAGGDLNIQRQPGANIIAVVDRVKALLPQLRGSLPRACRCRSSPTAPPPSVHP